MYASACESLRLPLPHLSSEQQPAISLKMRLQKVEGSISTLWCSKL